MLILKYLPTYYKLFILYVYVLQSYILLHAPIYHEAFILQRNIINENAYCTVVRLGYY